MSGENGLYLSGEEARLSVSGYTRRRQSEPRQSEPAKHGPPSYRQQPKPGRPDINDWPCVTSIDPRHTLFHLANAFL